MSLFKKIKVTKDGIYLLDPEYRKKFNKLTLSPSNINAWLASPADFILDKFILDEVSEREAPHFIRGKWFHSTMEEFYKVPPEDRNLKTLFKTAKKVTSMEDYYEFSKDIENQEWYKRALNGYVNLMLKDSPKEKVASLPILGSNQEGLELRIMGKIADTKRNCFGYIDKIIEGETGLIIQDWKTGASIHDYNPNLKISDSNPFDYWRQQTLYSMLLEKEGATIENTSLIFPLASPPQFVYIDQKNSRVREQVLNDVIQVDKEMTEAVEKDYFFPFKRGKYNGWSSWLGGLGSARKPDVIEPKFFALADLSEIGFK